MICTRVCISSRSVPEERGTRGPDSKVEGVEDSRHSVTSDRIYPHLFKPPPSRNEGSRPHEGVADRGLNTSPKTVCLSGPSGWS